jgi:hypothetical protein
MITETLFNYSPLPDELQHMDCTSVDVAPGDMPLMYRSSLAFHMRKQDQKSLQIFFKPSTVGESPTGPQPHFFSVQHISICIFFMFNIFQTDPIL